MDTKSKKETTRLKTSGLRNRTVQSDRTNRDIQGSSTVEEDEGRGVSTKRLLVRAIIEENTKRVKELIRKDKLDPNFEVDDEEARPTPLILATLVGNAKIVKYLLKSKEYPANVNTSDINGRTPLWFAVETNNTSVAETLIKESSLDCKVDYIDRCSGMSPLFLAVNTHSPDMCRALIQGGANVNRRRSQRSVTEMDETPLIRAVQLDDFDTVKVLLNSLADRNLKTIKGFAAMHYAVACRRYEILEELLQQRTDVYVQTSKGVNSMTIAISENLPEVVRLLVEYGYDTQRKFAWGETPFDMSVRAQSEECAMVLVHCGYPITPVKDADYYRQRKAHKKSIFFDVCGEGLLELARLMVNVYPQFLQETWLRTRDLPLALCNNEKFVDELTEACASPYPLLNLCISKIFVILKKCPYLKVSSLPGVSKLKSYFMFEQHFLSKRLKKRFQRQTLYTMECPFDCEYPCSKTQCPDIEFETSDDDLEPDVIDLDEDDFIDSVLLSNLLSAGSVVSSDEHVGD